MSSVHAFKSQVAPFKRYIVNTPVGGSQIGKIYDVTGDISSATTVAAGTVLRDMGKTVIIPLGGGTPLRKVQVLPVADSAAPLAFRTGYIYLENAPAAQNIVALN